MYGRWAHLETVGFEQWVNASTVSMSASSVGAGDVEEQSNSEPACLEVREIMGDDEREDVPQDSPANMLVEDQNGAHAGRATTIDQEAGQDRREPQWRHRPMLIRAVWLTVGVLSLAVGAVGIILPGLPTTPFILLATFCFARSSDTFLSWLINSKCFGPILREWHENRALPSRKVKIYAVSFALTCFGASIIYFAIFSPIWWISIILGALCVVVCTFLVRLPATPYSFRDDEDTQIESWWIIVIYFYH